MKVYDLIIVGAGPAGITASIYAARKRMDFVTITKDIGGMAAWSADIQNYAGFPFISGEELTQRFTEHMKKFNVQVQNNESVTRLEKNGDLFEIDTDEGRSYKAKTAIVASGRLPRMLGVEGEDKFRNKGLHYCATCDAPLYQDADVLVIGGGNSALDAVLQLVNIAKKVYVVDKAKTPTADALLVDKAVRSGKVTFFSDSVIKRVSGDQFVEGVTVLKGDGSEVELSVSGIFIEIGSGPNTQFVKGVSRNQWGEIIVNCKCETDVPGLYAAGDVSNVPLKQIIIACGEGAKAALAAFEYLNQH